MPAYQRPFAWGTVDVNRFLFDTVANMDAFAKGTKKLTFLGTMTCFHDNTYESIVPIIQKDVPQGVLHVVDGQQRLTTLMICALIAHNKIRTLKAECKSPWLKDRAVECLLKLSRTFELDKGVGEKPYYPKMIRAFDDCWSVNPESAQYISPLSYLISKYGEFSRLLENNNKSFPFNKLQLPLNVILSEAPKKGRNNFLILVNRATNTINQISKGSVNGNEKLQDVFNLYKCKDVVILVCNSLTEIPTDEGIDYEDKTQKELLRSLYFATYLMNCVHFVALISSDDNQVYDIFEALNTTGQPLTAIQTLNPDVIKFEGSLEKYNVSPSKKHFDVIEDCISLKEEPLEQQILSSDIVRYFAYAETGYRLEKHLSAQRLYLKKFYKETGKNENNDKEAEIKEKRKFSRQLMCCSLVLRYLWNKSHSDISVILGNIFVPDDVLLCLKYLVASKHKICIPLIARYYYEATKNTIHEHNIFELILEEQEEQENEKKDNKVKVTTIRGNFDELFAAIKACAAFFALWRSSREYTELIDDRYRRLFKIFARTESDGAIPSTAVLKQKFIDMLVEDDVSVKLINKDAYANAVYEVPLYKSQRNTANFCLLLAMHNAKPSTEIPHLYEDAKDPYHPTIYAEAWDDPRFSSVEHIIPKSEARDDLPVEVLHKLGNLTLLSIKVNRIISNRPWKERVLIYQVLSTISENNARKIWETGEHRPSGVSFEELWKEKFTNTVATLVALVDLEIKPAEIKSIIKDRSDNFSERVWEILYEKWLN